MAKLLTAAQMRAIEQAAIAEGSVTDLALMERAGQGVVDAVFEEWPELAATSHRAVVLCGPGNNGGDGFVIARLLKGWGWAVEVFFYGDAEKLPPDARVNYKRWLEMGTVHPLTAPALEAVRDTWRGGLIVDALFGIGLSRALPSALSEAWDPIFTYGFEPNFRVAVDVPSGLCAESGRVLGRDGEGRNVEPVFHADLTVTFECAKPGHVLAEGPEFVGKLSIAPLRLFRGAWSGVRRALIEYHGAEKSGRGLGKHLLAMSDDLAEDPSRLEKWVDDHKFNHGHALVLAGRSGKGGAARLAARGALRIGAGLVTVAPTPGALQENAAQLNAIMLEPVGDAEALSKVLEDARINALCLGPGLGVERAAALLPVALASGRKCALDADALTALAADPALFDTLHKDCVLTPHMGEFARLFPDIAEKLAAPATTGPAYSKVDAVRAAAARAGCAVLLKGPDTVIADASGSAAINAAAYERAAPWLATAGSGDVLAGFITGLLARGFPARNAAETGAYLHVEAARAFGPGLIAEDLPEMLPKVFADLGL